MFKRLIIIVATLFFLAPLWGNGALLAQQYPVQGSFAITPPYAVNLSDYANINLQNLALNITLTDMAVTNKRVRLKLFIQNQSSVIAQSTDNIQGEAVIQLDGGIPVRLSNSELATYFRLNNLQGISPDTYANALPEGVYTFGFEVYDYFTGSRLSNRISQTFWLIINNPPLLNTPADKSKQADFTTSGGGIVFNWTPRSTQVSNTDYEFTLCELWDPSGDPYQQFMSAIPKYQTTLSNATTLVYGLSQPPLSSGYTYAWRVRAKAKAGFEDVGLYRNNGYSDLFTFRYGNPCPAPQNLKTDVKSAEQINLTWEAPANSSGGESYLVSYRKYSIDGRWSWTTTSTTNLFFNVTNLEASTEYEFKTGRECSSSALIAGQAEAAYTDTQRATTLAPEQIAGVECGKEPVINISNQTLLPLLKANDVVMAGDFPVTITRVEGSPQGWSGEGWVKVPWLGDTRIRVKYASIRVNSDNKLIAGSFDTTYDPTGKNIGNVDETIEDAKGLVTGGTDVGKPITGTDATTYTLPYTLTDNDIATSTFTPAVATGETGSTTPAAGGTITFGNGQTLAVNDVPTTVKDGSGNIYQVSDKGKVTKIGNSGGGSLLASANLTVIDGSKGTVSFSAADDTKYAFDAWQKTYDANSTWKAKYETITLAGGGSYRVSSKLMLPGEADKVIATVALSDKSLSPDSIRFSNASGTLFEKTKLDNNRFELSLVGGPASDAQEIYALYPLNGKTYTLGKLLVASYQPRTVRLSLVPVNGTTVNEDAVRNQLEELYNPLGIDFDFSVEDNFNYTPLQNTPLQVEGSGLLSVYTDQMKALNNAFVASGNYEKGTVYLFVLPKGADKDGNEKGIEGAMPRAQQFGYLFTEGLNDKQLAQATAHEVGHGVFQLQHTFSYSGLKQGDLPNNIMDYTNSLSFGEGWGEVSKPQWDLIHDPGLVIGVFETDKGVESIAYKELNDIRLYNSGIAPNGAVIADIKVNNDSYKVIPAIQSNQFFIYGFSIYDKDKLIKAYLWKGDNFYSGETSIKDDNSITLTYNTTGSTVKTHIFRTIDNCIFQYALVDYNPRTKTLPAATAISNWTNGTYYNAQTNCFIELLNGSVNVECQNPDVVNQQKQNIENRINALDIHNENSVYLAVETINGACAGSIKMVSQSLLISAIAKLGSMSSISNSQEIAILRLMEGISDYSGMISKLTASNNALLNNLIDKFQDAIPVSFWTENSYTALIKYLSIAVREVHEKDMSKWDIETITNHVFNINATPFKSDAAANIWGGQFPLNQYRYRGSYNSSTGKVSIAAQELVRNIGDNTIGNNISDSWIPKTGEPTVQLDPLTPIVISNIGGLPLVQTALEGNNVSGNAYIVPAIFFHYLGDKELNDGIEKATYLTLDAITIAASGGTALAANVAWASRIWAMAEVAGAVGDIAGTTVEASNPKLKQVVDIYNGAMGLIGIKNLGKGIVNFAKVLPEETKNLIQNNQSIRNALMAKYLDYRIAITELICPEGIGIPQEYKSIIRQQDELYSELVAKLPVKFTNAEELIPFLKTQPDEAFFWSGRTNGVGGMDRALEIAKSKNGVTLEALVEKYNIDMPIWSEHPEVWDAVSEVYAKNAIGIVKAVIGKSLREINTWEKKELPALKANNKVSKIILIDPDNLSETTIFQR